MDFEVVVEALGVLKGLLAELAYQQVGVLGHIGA